MKSARNSLIALLTTLPLLAAGCGLEGDDESAPEPRSPGPRTTTTPRTTPDRPAEELAPRRGLPQPEAGVVEVNGEEKGALTADAVDGYSGGTVRASFDGATEALSQLCRGEIDIADSARPISRAEFEVCFRNGLELKTFQVASDAVVVAIRNETDIGADCLTMTQVQRIFETGSSIENWRDVSPDYFDVPLETGGPDEQANAFDYFAQRVLQVDDDATLDDFRSDYVPHPTDEGTKDQVVGDTQTELDRFIRILNRRQQNQAARIQTFYDRIIPLDRRIRRIDRRIREFDTIIGAGVDPEERSIKRQRDRLARQRAVLARRRATLDRQRRSLDRQRRELVGRLLPLIREARLRDRRNRGVVGLFRFSFYEQFENQLRPFEIEDNRTDDNDNERCVFPSQATVTQGVYPLARRLLLFTTQRSLARDEVKAFLTDYVQRSRDLAIDNRLVPIPEPQVNQELEELGGLGVREPTPQQQSGSDQQADEQAQEDESSPNLPNSDDGPSYRDEGSGP